jgi:hypothetical protein
LIWGGVSVSRLADRLFDFEECGKPTDEMAEADMVAFLKAASVPFDGVGWDYYDGSLEIYEVPGEWRMREDLQKKLWDEGFVQVYVNHAGPDHWETHYSFGTEKGFKAQRGWRVSYPHKRGECGGQIWVEERIKGWPSKWFRRFLRWKPYVAIKSNNTHE